MVKNRFTGTKNSVFSQKIVETCRLTKKFSCLYFLIKKTRPRPLTTGTSILKSPSLNFLLPAPKRDTEIQNMPTIG